MVRYRRTLNRKHKRTLSSKDGNVVIGFCTRNLLMLDLDLHSEAVAKKFVKCYSKFHKLGSVLLLKTSDSTVADAFGNELNNYSAIFGKVLSWKEIMWHLKECLRLEMIEPAFLRLRKFGYITIRVNAILLVVLAMLSVYSGVASWTGKAIWAVPFANKEIFQVSMAFLDLLGAVFMLDLALEKQQ